MWLVKKCVSLLRLKQQFPWWEKRAEINWCAEENVIRYLKSWNKDLKIDNYWNLYLINPWTPLLCAHMDTVQREDDAALAPKIYLDNEWKIHWDNIIIWWDDKCWIAIAMEMYERLWNQVSLLFPRQEETWCNWSAYFCQHNSELIRQCTYCLVLDRRGNADIISNGNCYCSLEFQNDLVRIWNEWGFDYHPEHWACSDANNIRHHINCVNLSVWYYNPHSKSEYVVADDLKKAYNFAMHIVQNLHWDWPIYVEPPKPVYEPKPVSDWWSKSYVYKPATSSQWWLFDDINARSKAEKKKDKRTNAQKETASCFKIKADGVLEIKKNLILYSEDREEFIDVPKGSYRVDTYNDDPTDLYDVI